MKNDIGKLIRAGKKSLRAPTGKDVEVLDGDQIQNIAEQCGTTVRKASIAAMELGICPHRYLRNGEILKIEEQLKLARSKVGIVGAGGLGGQVVILLARLGIGEMVVIDADVFDETNLNRQALSNMDAIGSPKVLTAQKVVGSINPAVEVTPHVESLNESNAEKLLGGVDLIVDALDNIPDRLLLDKTARFLCVPLIHGAIAGFDGQLTTLMPEGASLRTILGDGGKDDSGYISPEKLLGVPAVTASITASFQVMETLKVLLGRGEASVGYLTHINLETLRIDRFKF